MSPTPPHRTRNRVIVVAVAIGALALLVVAGLQLSQAPGQTGVEARRHPRLSTPKPPTPDAPDGPVTLRQGDSSLAGVYVGFPPTIIGAISAAGEYLSDLTSTLDPDRAASVYRLIADPAADPHGPDLSAQSVGKLRARLNLPTTGPLAPNVSFVVTPAMYQLRDVHADSVLVLILGTVAFTGAQGLTTTTGVFPMHMHWDAASHDWRLVRLGGPDEDYSSLAAPPGSPDADHKGWRALLAPVTH